MTSPPHFRAPENAHPPVAMATGQNILTPPPFSANTHLHGVGEVVYDGVQEGLHPLVLERRPAQNRRELARNGRPPERSLHQQKCWKMRHAAHPHQTRRKKASMPCKSMYDGSKSGAGQQGIHNEKQMIGSNGKPLYNEDSTPSTIAHRHRSLLRPKSRFFSPPPTKEQDPHQRTKAKKNIG